MDEEVVIRAVHHANDLAAAANAEKPKKMFEEMVPEEYRSFRDLFSKENFNEMPERTPWGPCHRARPQREGNARLQGISLESKRTGTVRQVPRREPGVGPYPPFQVALCLSFLLH